MDSFSSGIFCGQGITGRADLRPAASEDPFPPEQVLSHDILEGSLLRAGLVSDVAMTDGVPASLPAGCPGSIAGFGAIGRTHLSCSETVCRCAAG